MTHPTLVIKELSRLPYGNADDRLTFQPGVNVIVGPPNSGKTKWLRTLDYLLGDDGKAEDILEQLYEKYDSAKLTCEIGGEEFVIERHWRQPGLKTKAIVNGESLSVTTLRETILRNLTIPSVHYPQGDPYGARKWPELGWRSLYRHVFRRQAFWSDLADQQPESEQHACLLQFLGLAETLFSQEYARLIDKKKNIVALEYSKDQFMAMLEEISREILSEKELGVAITPQSMDAAERRIGEEIEAAQNKRKAILDDLLKKAVPGKARKAEEERQAVSDLTKQLVRLQAQMEELQVGVQKATDRLVEVGTYHRSLTEELGRLERASQAGELLGGLQVTHCPVCDRAIQKTEADEGRCFLCKRPDVVTPASEEASEKRFEFEKAQLNGEVEETDELLEALKKEIKQLNESRTKVAEDINRIQAKLRPVRSAAVAVLPPEVSLLDMEAGRLQERLQQLARVRVALTKRETIMAEIDVIQTQVDELEVEVKEQNSRLRYSESSQLLEDGMNTYLNKIKMLNPRSWTQADKVFIKISDKKFSFKVGKSNWKAKLGGTLTLYFLMAYHYGLMGLTARTGCHYPGLTILDLPAKLEDGSTVKEKENFVVEPFVELLSQNNMKNTQFIAAGSSFKELENAHRIQMKTVWTK